MTWAAFWIGYLGAAFFAWPLGARMIDQHQDHLHGFELGEAFFAVLGGFLLALLWPFGLPAVWIMTGLLEEDSDSERVES